jgi:hypothetical protein
MAGTLTISTLSDGTNSTSATNCIQGSAKAWVNFNGTGTVAIRASYNVSSITDNGTGDYTVNFTTAMPNADYAIASSCGGYIDGNAPTNLQVFNDTARAPTTTSVRLFAADTNTTNYRDVKLAFVTIFSS